MKKATCKWVFYDGWFKDEMFDRWRKAEVNEFVCKSVMLKHDGVVQERGPLF